MKSVTDTPIKRVACLSASALSLFLASCGSNDQVGYIAPPAAIPGEDAAADLTNPEPVAEPAAIAPEPFEIREGEKLVKYRIQKGDSLEKIGKAFGTTPSRIRSANGMTSDMIYYGRSLKVPTTKEVVAAQAPAPAAAATPVAPRVAPTPAPKPAAVAPAPVKPAPKPAIPQLQIQTPQPIVPPTPPVPQQTPASSGIQTGPSNGGLQFSD